MTCRINADKLALYRARAERGRVVVFDTETTGTSNADEIVQIAAVEYVNGAQARTMSVYVVPTCRISPGAAAVHHLTRAFLKKNGTSPTDALSQFFAFLGDDALLVAHNLNFDLRMLRNECCKFGYEAALDEAACCDTLALARRLVPGLEHYNLGTLIEELGLAGENSHEALDDARACAALFFDLVRRIA